MAERVARVEGGGGGIGSGGGGSGQVGAASRAIDFDNFLGDDSSSSSITTFSPNSAANASASVPSNVTFPGVVRPSGASPTSSLFPPYLTSASAVASPASITVGSGGGGIGVVGSHRAEGSADSAASAIGRRQNRGVLLRQFLRDQKKKSSKKKRKKEKKKKKKKLRKKQFGTSALTTTTTTSSGKESSGTGSSDDTDDAADAEVVDDEDANVDSAGAEESSADADVEAADESDAVSDVIASSKATTTSTTSTRRSHAKSRGGDDESRLTDRDATPEAVLPPRQPATAAIVTPLKSGNSGNTGSGSGGGGSADRKLQGKPKVLLECISNSVEMEAFYRRSSRPVKQKAHDKDEGYQVPELSKAKVPEVTKAKAPEVTKVKAPELSMAKMGELSKVKAPELSKAKAPEVTKARVEPTPTTPKVDRDRLLPPSVDVGLSLNSSSSSSSLSCSDCAVAAFASASQLVLHQMATHKTFRPFVCLFCGKS